MFDNLFDNLDDPRRQALLMAAAGLLSPVRGKGMAGFGEAMSRGIEGGLLGFNQASNAKQSKEMRELQKKMLDAQLQGQTREQQFTEALAKGMKPGVGATPLTRVDDEGYQMPSPNPTFDLTAARALDPMKALQFEALLNKQPATVTLKEGEVAYDPNTRLPVFQNPKHDKPDKPKYVKGDMQTYSSNGITYTREFDGQEWKTIAKSPQWKPDGPEKPPAPPSGYRYKADGTLEKIPGGPAEERGKPSEAELKAAGYAYRMDSANGLMGAPNAQLGMVQTFANNRLPGLAPFVSSPEQQKYRQAQEDWVRAKLRQESGAVIADEEMAREIRVYFPQPGDSPAVIKQKAEARQRATDAMFLASGKAREQIPARQPNIEELLRRYGGGR